MKWVARLLLVLIAVGIFGAGMWYAGRSQRQPAPPVEQSQEITSDKEPELPRETTKEQPSSIDAIRAAFAKKYDKAESDVVIDVRQETLTHARGNVQFLPAGEVGNAGMFLTKKINGEWTIIFDGHGVPNCQTLAQYEFPKVMLTGLCE